jgi:hypothetical protein
MPDCDIAVERGLKVEMLCLDPPGHPGTHPKGEVIVDSGEDFEEFKRVGWLTRGY